MFLDELEGIPPDSASPTTAIFLDSSSAIAMGNSFRDTKHTRHILRRYHFVRVGVEANRYKLLWIATLGQLADIGTKQLPGPLMETMTTYTLVHTQDSSVQEG
jgi:hypothetical protein